MSSDPLARSDIWDGAPSETEYEALYAAVTSTVRGRWFLAEYASRNRQADTQALAEAIARVEVAVRGKASAPPDLSTALDCIRDVAFVLRERGTDASLCDALDAAVRELARVGGEGNGNELRPRSSAVELLHAGDDFSVAAESRRIPDAVSPPDMLRNGLRPVSAEEEDRRPRWYIEPPDFAFANKPQAVETALRELTTSSEETHALLPEARLLPGPSDDPADLFESPTTNGTSAATVSATTPSPPIPAASLPRTAPPDPFAGARALSAEELVALFS